MTTLEVLGYINLFGRVESVSVARDYVADLLKEAGYTLLDDALMLVSELVTNSIRHSESGRRLHGLITVVVATAGDMIRIDVIDEGSAAPLPPIPLQVDHLNEGGRGLWLMRELSSDWGWTEDGSGRVFWFEVAGR